MDRRTFHRSLLFTTIAAPLVSAGSAQARPVRGVPRRSVFEFGLPPAEQTHELVKVPGLSLLLVSQMSNSHLVKARLDPATEQVVATRAHPVGGEQAMLHGLALSHRYPGLVWATQQGDNRLLLIDPNGADVDSPPQVLSTIDVPAPGRGPHYIGEYGDQLWVSLKESNHVLEIDHTDPSSFHLYEAHPNPIFVAQHPVSGEFYASQDDSSQILRINAHTQQAGQLDIPPEHGGTPVGLIAGPTALWVALLGTQEQGTGTFGRIDANGDTTWFRLRSSEVADAGLLHIAFEPEGGSRPSAWLLGSSIICDDVYDVVVRVTFDAGYNEVLGEEVTVLPTQHCKAHRLLPLSRSLYVTELTSSTLAQLTTVSWDRPTDPAPGDPS
ncbi:hypothetical protein ACIQMJ_34060 [Actinosynnema sp. NPDC091369]